jgi:calpain-15
MHMLLNRAPSVVCDFINVVPESMVRDTISTDPPIAHPRPPSTTSHYDRHEPIAHAWLPIDKIIPSEGGSDRSKKKWVVFRDPSPSDIVQGGLGNCWFLGALAVLAEKPDLVKNLFITKEYSAGGAYQLQLFLDGNWETILLDDTFPVRKDRRFAYSQGRDGQLWVPLLEKAMAAVRGCYEGLQKGGMSDAFRALTGCTSGFSRCGCRHVYLACLRDT